jgi:hypothetical protein
LNVFLGRNHILLFYQARALEESLFNESREVLRFSVEAPKTSPSRLLGYGSMSLFRIA